VADATLRCSLTADGFQCSANLSSAPTMRIESRRFSRRTSGGIRSSPAAYPEERPKRGAPSSCGAGRGHRQSLPPASKRHQVRRSRTLVGQRCFPFHHIDQHDPDPNAPSSQRLTAIPMLARHACHLSQPQASSQSWRAPRSDGSPQLVVFGGGVSNFATSCVAPTRALPSHF
jgi:hypothetical protein